ncbi:hypothetical protein [Gloeocapsopsis dulcis]|uniref:Uncharacterized protein n=1 Tax=Gloeocapsopsis dulcis AAB1 = 1H9 TaxID=1433147 RepID=A0A6N8FXF9_9CHRO|nr:hypothetical protein [Gloeocapsopsis dulcis]MUL37444.1 hypothetical protein [Gloeocapsopsis dulcis AAB1 = 1H9]WNN87419.1 hypothetical protein P0S91_13875 [Gloeocapsopsis dulcis]
MSQIYYLIRSRADGRYLVAHPRVTSGTENNGYLLMFREDFDALSYLNTHGADVADQFAVESVAGSQIGSLLQRWSFVGVGIVQDPLLPKVEFLTNF